MKLAVIVSFLDEAAYLPTLLASMRSQTRKPDLLLLVDDGSSDRSAELAEAFAQECDYARAMRRPPRPPERDRLATAAELVSFLWAVDQLGDEYDLVAKMDADLKLSSDLFETVVSAFESDSQLGMAGPYLSAKTGARLTRERCPAWHVRGPARFYRRACFNRISPIPPILGWDTIDEARARRVGWTTRSLEMPMGDTIHLRPTGSLQGSLRGARRRGIAAYASGMDPAWLVAGAVSRFFKERPRMLDAANYLSGWAVAYVRRHARAEPELRAFVRREQRSRMAAALRLVRRRREAASPTI